MPDVHSKARTGFGNAAQTYTRGRPDYPPELLAWLRQTLALGPGKTAIDLGAGSPRHDRIPLSDTRLLLRSTMTHSVARQPADFDDT
jgi:hypothetical protein